MKTGTIGLLLLPAAAVAVLASTATPPYDFFRVLQTFDKIIAAEISWSHTPVMCLTAETVELDLANRTCTFEASWKEGTAKTPLVRVNFTFAAGDSVDQLISPDPQFGDLTVHLLHTDYSTCALTKFRRLREVCILWISDNARESIPSICHEKFERHCGTEHTTLYPDERCATPAGHAAL